MADTRQRTTWGNRFRFLARALGLLGLLAAISGVVLLWAQFRSADFFTPERLRAAVEGANGQYVQVAAYLAGIGGAAVLLIILIEMLSSLVTGVGRRTAAGTVATIGAVAAVVLLVFVNLISFTHYKRVDCTRDKRFTLPPELAAEFGKLRASAPTTIVVHQTHNFGPLMSTRDSFTKATEAEVTTKVRDLVELFREFGPQFKVVVLDTEAFEYRKDLEELTKDAPELLAAIKAAPENSIFFHANKRVQRLAFNEFMQLDKTASEEADGGRANLVLVPQGIDRFAQRVLTVQERRPKVAVCVVHELLTTAGDDPRNRYTLAGVRKSLTTQGFDVVDVVLKKNWNNARSLSDLKPAADTREESKLERLEGDLDDADALVTSVRAEVRQFEVIRGFVDKVKDRPWEERKAFYQQFVRGTLTEAKEPELLAMLASRLKRAREKLEEAAKAKQEAEKNLAEVMQDERALQDRRMSNVSTKLTKQLADVDLLIIVRHTTEDAMKGPGIEAGLHALSKEQVKVAKEFMKQGKPVLACLGPITPQVASQPGESPEDFDKRLVTEFAGASDDFERMLTERGVELGSTVILFEGETKAITRGGQFGNTQSEVPPLLIAEPPTDSGLQPNPVAAAFRLTGRTAVLESDSDRLANDAAAKRKFEIRLRAIRPVSLAPNWQAKQPFAAEIAFTSADSWNTFQPYPQMGRTVRIPTYTPTDINDPKKGTRDEERKGPFPIAVAVENKVPATWVNEDYERQEATAALLTPYDSTFAMGLTVGASKLERPTQRMVVFGNGNMFTAPKLDPPEEKLLLHSVNWLTNREDRLPRAATEKTPEWHYPRVAMSDRDRILWQGGTLFGLPLLVAALGLFVMLLRRIR